MSKSSCMYLFFSPPTEKASAHQPFTRLVNPVNKNTLFAYLVNYADIVLLCFHVDPTYRNRRFQQDLAGSERLSSSGAANDRDRLRETQAINKSLSALGDVIASLGAAGDAGSNKQTVHIPYRNSKVRHSFPPHHRLRARPPIQAFVTLLASICGACFPRPS